MSCPALLASCIVTIMKNTTLAFIGCGNMARSLIGGLIADGWDPSRIRAADADPAQLERISRTFPVSTYTENEAAAAGADVVVLAVKPQITAAVALELSGTIAQQQPLVISIAAGIRESALRSWLGEQTAIVRSMPNTPAMVQSGVTALYANPAVSEARRSIAESILRAVGVALWIEDEALMDAVTALSGSGPAYFFLFMEALQTAGIGMGLPPETARLLTLQTAIGAAKMALESSEDVTRLRRQVTSPGGTTESAVAVLEANGFADLVNKALQAAASRSRELADEFGASS
jgi:pyrroline-5-carboxylate reductase